MGARAAQAVGWSQILFSVERTSGGRASCEGVTGCDQRKLDCRIIPASWKQSAVIPAITSIEQPHMTWQVSLYVCRAKCNMDKVYIYRTDSDLHC